MWGCGRCFYGEREPERLFLQEQFFKVFFVMENGTPLLCNYFQFRSCWKLGVSHNVACVTGFFFFFINTYMPSQERRGFMYYKLSST